MNKKTTTRLLACFCFVLTGCNGKIPPNYRGTFVDAEGDTLVLAKKKGTLTLASGRVISNAAEVFGFDKIAQGKAGIYVKEDEQRDGIVFLRWLVPDIDPSARDERFRFGWYKAEVVSTELDRREKRRVDFLKLLYCDSSAGLVQLDYQDREMTGGCPAGPRTRVLEMRRVEGR